MQDKKREYVEQRGKAPEGPEYEAWHKKKTGGDHSDSNMAKVFGGDGSPKPLKKGELSFPQKMYLKEKSTVKVGESAKDGAKAVARVKANQEAERKRRARKEPDIESY